MDGSPNEVSEISKVVNVLLQYGTHSKRILFAISGLRKQDLILEYNWLKDHNLKVNWETSKVEMTCYSLCCEEDYAIHKEQIRQKKVEL